MQNYEARRHHQQPKKTLPFVKLPSFNGDSDPNVFLGWEAKVEFFLMHMRSKRAKRLS